MNGINADNVRTKMQSGLESIGVHPIHPFQTPFQVFPLFSPNNHRHWGRSSHSSCMVLYIFNPLTTLSTGAAKIAS
jgi:hypothetical protein